ncbi:tRNA glutamyl-Q(34) synthetase GluQRS [Methyloceanibacter superfactus]|nr:tRNA glutamyl-Q(34) synthetase GluQRS [Methyloceanibacter superfactus]
MAERTMPGRFVTRFAPSPTGLLHLGHVFSALTAWEGAQGAGGDCLLRIEDTDQARARPEYEAAIYEDLAWLGLNWPEPVWRQSERLDIYAAALERLGQMGVTYPCRCTRADIRAALSAPQEGAEHLSPDGAVYPGTCRGRALADCGPGDAIRLDLERALALLGGQTLIWRETGRAHAGTHTVDPDIMRRQIGDVVLGRKDIGAAAYHLSVVVDDAAQGVTHVIRGEDLFEATPIHRLLQALLELPVPVYHHHVLIRDAEGKRLAKRNDACAIRTYREAGRTPEEVKRMMKGEGL